MMADQQYINSTITKINGRNKVVDFRDGLVVATTNDYAMMHGAGGSKHAPNSVIKITICDYSKGTGDNSVTVAANIKPEQVAILRAVAERCVASPMGQKVSVGTSDIFAVTQDEFAKIEESLRLMVSTSKNGNKLEGDNFVKVGANLRAVYNSLKAADSTQGADPQSKGFDYEYTQDRVNPYKNSYSKDIPEGYAPVTKLQITHQPFYNGRVSSYPWCFKITSGIAIPQENELGGVSAKRGSFKEQSTAFINVSNVDMFAAMEDCMRFIRAWELAFGIPVIKAGETAREEARKKAAYNN